MTQQLLGAIIANTILFIIIGLLNRKRRVSHGGTGKNQLRDARGRFANEIRWVTDFKGIV